MNNIIKILTDGKKRLTIFYDTWAEDPRRYNDSFLTKILSISKKYDIGEYVEADNLDELKEEAKRRGAGLVLPLWLLDHSGIALSLGKFASDPQQWDSGIVGVAYILQSDIDANNIKEAYQTMAEELKTLEQYFNGDVYGAIVEEARQYTSIKTYKDNGEKVEEEGEEWDTIDQTGNFYNIDELISASGLNTSNLKDITND
jgi:hypothetical protein